MQAPSASFKPHNRFVVLDVLRGVAAFSVMLYHFRTVSPHFLTYVAVDFFLILSGFILTHAYFRKGEVSFVDFVLTRAARLYPLHLVTLLVSGLLVLIAGKYFDRSDFVLHLLMIHNIGFGPDGFAFNAPSWSISVEFWTNAIMAGLFVLFTAQFAAQRVRIWILLAITVASYTVLAVSVGHLNAHYQNIQPFVNAGLIRAMGGFALGMLVYDLCLIADKTMTASQRSAIGACTPILIGAFCASLFIPLKDTGFDFLLIPFFAIVVAVAAFEIGPAADHLKHLQWLGTISFALYLVHHPVLEFYYFALPGDTPFLVRFCLVIPTALILAQLAHSHIEMPVYRVLKRLIAKRRTPSLGEARSAG
ncbi:MAG: acyltransferase [Pseudomonadota bacterium]